MKKSDADKQSIFDSQLHEIVSQYGLSLFAIENLIKFANLRPSLTAFSVIAAKLIPILYQVIAILEIDDGEDELLDSIPSWIECCENIVSHRIEIEQVVPDFNFQGSSTSWSPFKGYYEDYPLGATLWYCAADAGLSQSYVLLQAYLCLSWQLAIRIEAEKDFRYTNAKEQACLATRNMASQYLANILIALPATPLSITEYRDKLNHWDFDRDICRLRALFTHVLEARAPQTYSGRASPNKPRQAGESPFGSNRKLISFAEDDEKHPASIKTGTVPSLSESQMLLQQQNLCSNEEFTSPSEAIEAENEGPDPSGGFSRSQYKLLVRGQVAAIALHNQRLPCEWDQLTSYEAQQFLYWLARLSEGRLRKFGDVPHTELAAFLSILFWSSSTFTDICACTLVPASKRSTVQISILRVNDGPWLWIIKPLVPKQTLVPEQILKDQTLTRTERFSLPIPPEAQIILKRHLASFPVGSRVKKVFSLSEDTYKEAARQFIIKVKFWSGGRQTIQRISTYLYEMISRIPGADITTAMAISGRFDANGLVPLHYTAIAVSRIETCYETVCSQIRGDITNENKQQKSCSVSKDEMHVGSRYVPRQETVKELVSRLRQLIAAAHINKGRDEQSMIDLHNAITIYTVKMIGFATGYRNVRDPLLQEAEIDRETGFAVISDKDDNVFYHSRIVWLPDLCLQQLDLYSKHLELFTEWLFLNNQERFFKVREEAVTGHKADRTNPALIVIWKSGRDNPLSPKVIKHLVGDVGYDLPGNANRHYLRSMLLARKCPLDVIDALMGHWSRGTESWGRYSGISPLSYREELTHHLVELLDNDGWGLEPGLGKVS